MKTSVTLIAKNADIYSKNGSEMDEKVLNELQEIKKLTTLGAKNVLTMNDVALLTGLSKSFLYKKVCDKGIPHWKSDGGKLTYFDKSEVEAWMLHRRIKTQAEIEAEATAYVTTGNRINK